MEIRNVLERLKLLTNDDREDLLFEAELAMRCSG